MTNAAGHDCATHTRLVVRVLQDVLRAERFESYADLAEAVKQRCARARIFYDAGVISEAIARVELGGAQPVIASRLPRRLVEREPEPGIGHADAAAILQRLGIEL